MSCYFKRKFLRDTLRSLANQTRPPDEVIIVIDDTFNLYKPVKKYPFKLIIVSTNRINNEYRTSVYGMNKGIEVARGDVIVIVSPETLHGSHNIELIEKALINNPMRIVYAQRFYFQQSQAHITDEVIKNPDLIEQKTPIIVWHDGRISKDQEVVRQDNMVTGLFATYKKHFLEIGGFDKTRAHWGNNDIDINTRFKLLELDFYFTKDIFGIHRWHKRPPKKHMKIAVPIKLKMGEAKQHKAIKGMHEK